MITEARIQEIEFEERRKELRDRRQGGGRNTDSWHLRKEYASLMLMGVLSACGYFYMVIQHLESVAIEHTIEIEHLKTGSGKVEAQMRDGFNDLKIDIRNLAADMRIRPERR